MQHQKGQQWECRQAAPHQPSSSSKMCHCAVHTQSTWNTIFPEELISGRKRASVNTFPSSSLVVPAHCPHFTTANSWQTWVWSLTPERHPAAPTKQPLWSSILDRVHVVRGATFSVMKPNRFSSQQKILLGCLRKVVSGLKQMAAALSVSFFKGHRTTHVVCDKYKRDCSYPYFDVLRS